MSCFELVCGYDDIKAELMRIHDVLRHREKYEKLSVKSPRGLLLYGDPGLGKTRMAECFIGEWIFPVFEISKEEEQSFTVKEGATAATLYVQRTGTEGAMRVRYATQADTAIPGTNYYPVTDGELFWPAGNKAVKTVKINLIPDAMAQWETSNKVFTVRLYPVDEYDLADGEYLPRIAGDTATVTIVESSKKLPGKVALASYGTDETAVANAAKPAVTGTAGTPLTLTFTRTGGTDGPVSVKVSSPTAAQAKANKDTALVGKDYEAFAAQLDWEDGDDTPKTVTVNLLPSTNYAASKKFVFTIAAVKTDGTLPTLAAKTATLTILNDTVAETSAAYAKTIAAATGLKLESTGTWFNDYDGALRSGAVNGTLTYTLTGPGLFACEPTVVFPDSSADAATLTCQFVTKSGNKVTWNETVTDFSSRLVRIVPAGTPRAHRSRRHDDREVHAERRDGRRVREVRAAGGRFAVRLGTVRGRGSCGVVEGWNARADEQVRGEEGRCPDAGLDASRRVDGRIQPLLPRAARHNGEADGGSRV